MELIRTGGPLIRRCVDTDSQRRVARLARDHTLTAGFTESRDPSPSHRAGALPGRTLRSQSHGSVGSIDRIPYDP